MKRFASFLFTGLLIIAISSCNPETAKDDETLYQTDINATDKDETSSGGDKGDD